MLMLSSSARAVGTYDNAAIADKALTYWNGSNTNRASGAAACNDAQKPGDSGGQCRAFVNCIVWMVSNHSQNLGGSDYFQTFLNAGGTQITDVNNLVKGDIVQRYASSSDLHTFIIVSRVSGSDFMVVDSNHWGDETVGYYQRTVVLDSTDRAYRMGTVTTSTSGVKSGRVVGSVDFNHDGITDYVIYAGGQWAVKSGAGTNPYLAQGVVLGASSDTPMLGDFNGDNIPDYVIYAGGQWAVKSGAGTNPYLAQGVSLGGPNDIPLVADYNGDGIADYIVYSGGQWAIKSGVSPNNYLAQGIALGSNGCQPFLRDFNKDGVADFVISCGGQWAIKSGVSPYPYLAQGVVLGGSTDVPLLGDFNADGTPDFVIDSGGQWAVRSGASPYGYLAQGVSLGGPSDTPLAG